MKGHEGKRQDRVGAALSVMDARRLAKEYESCVTRSVTVQGSVGRWRESTGRRLAEV